MTFRGTNAVEEVSLSSVSTYATCRISRLASKDQARRRLLHIGFVPGAQVTPIRRSPTGDPTAYSVRGAMVALRREQADEIMVTPDVAPSHDSESPDNDINTHRACHLGQVPACLITPDNLNRLTHRARIRLAYRVPGVMGIRGKPTPRYTVALAGNPNTGKSALFNALTGLNQHTGNWPGKTVRVAEGFSMHKGAWFRLIDLPGTYSLLASSKEEEVARDFICFGAPDVTVVVTDATCLERNLDLVLEILEVTSRVVVALNLVDEAYRKKISIDIQGLSSSLGVPVVPTVARLGRGLIRLMDTVQAVADRHIVTDPLQPKYDERVEGIVNLIEPWIENVIQRDSCSLPPRWIALRLLDGDPELREELFERLTRAVSEGGMSA
jgi:Fe2+ transport system protein FeoA/energy-coupling factor transporter ATP-binding protein EcfA2